MRLQIIIVCEIFVLFGCALATQNIWTNREFMQPQRSRARASGNPQFRVESSAETTTVSAPTIDPFYEFNRKLFYTLGPPYSRYNMIFSPFSLQTLLAFIYTGSEGQTAQELRAALEIPEMPAEVARLFQSIISDTKRQTSEDLKFNMVNNMYYKDYLGVNYDFYIRSTKYFEAEVYPVNFERPVYAAAEINKMVEDKTNQRIQDLIRPETLYADTQAILVNAIYLKAKWAREFSVSDTQAEEFYVSRGRKVPVHMMYLEDEFYVGEIPDLKAKAIDLPFKNSKMSMLVVLPNDIDGLERLEIALGNMHLQSLNNFLTREQVTLRMPKFEFEFSVDMSAALMTYGVSRLFSDYAQLDGFFNNQTVRIGKIQHKAYINVNEGGVEAAAASFGKLLPLSLPLKTNLFTINHPFAFVIRSPDAVYFAGHVVKP